MGESREQENRNLADDKQYAVKFGYGLVRVSKENNCIEDLSLGGGSDLLLNRQLG